MIINLLIFVIVLLFLIFRYKNTVVVLAPISPFLSMFYVPYSSKMPFDLFGLIILCVFSLLPLHMGIRLIRNNTYPFWLPTCIVGLSFFLSNWYAKEVHWYSSFMEYSVAYIYPIVLYMCLNNKKRIRLFINTLVLFLICLCLYSFYELITGSNPFIHFLVINKISTNAVFEITEIRFGLKRLQSFLGYHVTFGYMCAMGFVALMYLKSYFIKYIKYNNVIILFLSFSLVCGVLFSGTRSAILGFVVGLFTLINFKMIKRYLIYILFLIITIISITYYGTSYFPKIIDSFIHTEKVEGSDKNLRTIQLGISLLYWAQSPIIGNGPAYITNVVKVNDANIKGYESIWFPLLVNYGLLGCFAFIMVLLFSLIKLIKMDMKPLVYFVLMFLTTKTLSSVPCINDGFYLLFVVFFIRIKEISIKKYSYENKYNYSGT